MAFSLHPVPLHPQEDARLQSLAELQALDSAPDPTLDALTQGARLALGADGAFISLVAQDRQWMKSRSNVSLTETPRDIAFCSHTILQDGPLIVPDATADPRFKNNPLVTGAPWIRMYTGIPLRGPRGLPVGTLCVINNKPTQPTAQQVDTLASLASVAEELLRAQAPATLQLQLQRQIGYDTLATVPRVLTLRDRIEQRRKEAEAEGALIQLVFIRLHRLSTMQAVLGPALYQRAMQTMLARISSVAPHTELCQLTGDDLLLVSGSLASPLLGRALATVVADRLCDSINLDGVVTVFDGYVGVSQSQLCTSAEELITGAELAAQEAQQRKQQTPCYFNTVLKSAHGARQRIVTQLQGAETRDEMWMAYQPKVCPYTGKTDSVEALLRWTSPTLGPISPGEFIPLAEHSGQIVRLGRWLMRQACQEAGQWYRAGHDIRVAINVSALQLKQPDFADQIAVALIDAGLPPSMLELELTESALIDPQPQIRQMLAELRALGIQLALDDFGTGYSSLAQLRQLAFDTIKIDKSFVDNIDSDEKDAALFQAMVRMIHELGMKTTVEGVENTLQLEQVCAAGCHRVQGWLYSQALSLDELLDFLGEARRVV